MFSLLLNKRRIWLNDVYSLGEVRPVFELGELPDFGESLTNIQEFRSTSRESLLSHAQKIFFNIATDNIICKTYPASRRILILNSKIIYDSNKGIKSSGIRYRWCKVYERLPRMRTNRACTHAQTRVGVACADGGVACVWVLFQYTCADYVVARGWEFFCFARISKH